jgi:hypothetical protein
MTREDHWIIACAVAVVLVSPLYGYVIGKTGKDRSWNGTTIKKVAALPLAVVGAIGQIAAVLVSHYAAAHSVWTALPWPVVWLGGFFALLAAAKAAGIPVKREAGEHLSTR